MLQSKLHSWIYKKKKNVQTETNVDWLQFIPHYVSHPPPFFSPTMTHFHKLTELTSLGFIVKAEAEKSVVC